MIRRRRNNDIIIEHPGVSSSHARLVKQGQEFLLEDLGSTNGTYINDERLAAPRMIREGDVIKFGKEVACRVTRD